MFDELIALNVPNLDVIGKNPFVDSFSSMSHEGPPLEAGLLNKVRESTTMVQMEMGYQ